MVVYSCFRSSPFAFRHSLETVSPCTPRLSVAAYVVKKIVRHNEMQYYLPIQALELRLFTAYLNL